MRRRDLLYGAAACLVPGVSAAAEGVPLREVVAQLLALADAMEEDRTIQEGFDDFVSARELEPTAALRRDYARVRLAFEATRDGGWWHLRWAITNRKPNSEAIWAQWREDPGLFDDAGQVLPSATAECDELSALFAFLVRHLGVAEVGLLWPQWNHVVAVWTLTQADTPHRIVVPTSQIFLDADASLGTDGFNPWKQKTIFTYRRRDASLDLRLPEVLADAFVAQAWAHAFESLSDAQTRRNARSRVLDGS